MPIRENKVENARVVLEVEDSIILCANLSSSVKICNVQNTCQSCKQVRKDEVVADEKDHEVPGQLWEWRPSHVPSGPAAGGTCC